MSTYVRVTTVHTTDTRYIKALISPAIFQMENFQPQVVDRKDTENGTFSNGLDLYKSNDTTPSASSTINPTNGHDSDEHRNCWPH